MDTNPIIDILRAQREIIVIIWVSHKCRDCGFVSSVVFFSISATGRFTDSHPVSLLLHEGFISVTSQHSNVVTYTEIPKYFTISSPDLNIWNSMLFYIFELVYLPFTKLI